MYYFPPDELGETNRVHLVTAVQAMAMFIATNIDDLVVLAVFFGRARGDRSATVRVIVGQYAGFIAMLAVSVVGALGARLLPDTAIAYFGLVPLLLGIRAAWVAWRHRRDDQDDQEVGGRAGLGTATVAAVTFANGGDHIGVYVPVFAVAGPSGMPAYVIAFLLGVGLAVRVGGGCPHGFECVVDLAVDESPPGRVHGLHPVPGVIPRRFEVGDAGDRTGLVAGLHCGEGVGHDGEERGHVGWRNFALAAWPDGVAVTTGRASEKCDDRLNVIAREDHLDVRARVSGGGGNADGSTQLRHGRHDRGIADATGCPGGSCGCALSGRPDRR
jgi:cadmium resistance protein CadD (predicted permease)